MFLTHSIPCRNASYLSAKKARNPGVNDRPGGSARGGKLGRGGLSLNNARGFPCVVGTCEPGKVPKHEADFFQPCFFLFLFLHSLVVNGDGLLL